jgi:hypothetical protein
MQRSLLVYIDYFAPFVMEKFERRKKASGRLTCDFARRHKSGLTWSSLAQARLLQNLCTTVAQARCYKEKT